MANNVAETEPTTVESPKDRAADWKVVRLETGRKFYASDSLQTVSWIPPQSSWNCLLGLPYGQEVGILPGNHVYFICHNNRVTGSSDLKRSVQEEDPKQEDKQAPTRTLTAQRDPLIGFGFSIAEPTHALVVEVAKGGPLHKRLHCGDKIVAVNRQPVLHLSFKELVERIALTDNSIELEILSDVAPCNGQNLNSRCPAWKSSFLSHQTRTRRQSCPVSVHFADSPVMIHRQHPRPSLSTDEISQSLPNAVRINLEENSTKAMRYTHFTTVKDVVESLLSRIGISATEYFSLVLVSEDSHEDTIVGLNKPIEEVVNQSSNLSAQLWLRVCWWPASWGGILKQDELAFSYIYKQVLNRFLRSEVVYSHVMGQVSQLVVMAFIVSMFTSDPPVLSRQKLGHKMVKGSLQAFIPPQLRDLLDERRVMRDVLDVFDYISRHAESYHLSPLRSAQLVFLEGFLTLQTLKQEKYRAHIHLSDVRNDPSVKPTTLIVDSSGYLMQESATTLELSPLTTFSAIIGLIKFASRDPLQSHLAIILESRPKIVLSLPSADAARFYTTLVGYANIHQNSGTIIALDLQETLPSYLEDDVPPYHSHHLTLPTSWNHEAGLDAFCKENLNNADGNVGTQENFRIDFSLLPTYVELSISMLETGPGEIPLYGLQSNGPEKPEWGPTVHWPLVKRNSFFRTCSPNWNSSSSSSDDDNEGEDEGEKQRSRSLSSDASLVDCIPSPIKSSSFVSKLSVLDPDLQRQQFVANVEGDHTTSFMRETTSPEACHNDQTQGLIS